MDYNANIGIDIVEYDDLVGVAVEGEVDLSVAGLFEISEDNRGLLRLTRGSSQVRRLMEVTGVRRYLSFGPPLTRAADDHRATDRIRLTG